jgi:glycosyltransferase involved in cell wall biosynthesis
MTQGSTSESVLIATPVLLIGGTEIQTLTVVRVLVEARYKVLVCCYYEFDENVINQFKQAGAEVILLGMNRKDSLYDLAKQLFKLFKEVRPDIVHVQYLAPGLIPIIAARLSGVRTLFATVHQSGRPYGWKEKVLLRTAAKLSTGFFCVSKAAEESWFGDSALWSPDAAKNGRKHFTIYNGVDCERIQRIVKEIVPDDLKASLGIAGRPVVGVVGRLREEKGHVWLLKAMVDIVKVIPDVVLLVVGDGPDRDLLREQAENLGIAPQVIWAGQTPPNEVYRMYAAMDVVAVPSLFEGFGLTAAEAMAAGLPVVGTRVDGLSEIIEGGVTGYILPAGDSHELANVLIQMLSNPEEREMMGQKGKDRVQELFSLQRFNRSTLAAYDELSRH